MSIGTFIENYRGWDITAKGTVFYACKGEEILYSWIGKEQLKQLIDSKGR